MMRWSVVFYFTDDEPSPLVAVEDFCAMFALSRSHGM